ncbi:MAG: phosphoglycolate phosphatase [Zoogloeaceae bacterium]|jgi:phosphoglycolate phosphatase|nr:phosphoglycolate phosphatase [Zoogloeaceae bacterium]
MPVISSVTFDLDGTLLDTARDLAVACQRTLAAMGKPTRDEAEIRLFVGKGMRVLIERCLSWETPPAEDELAEGMRLFPLYYAEENGRAAMPYPGVLEGLSAFFSAGVPLAVVTNKRLVYTLPLLQKTGLSGYFQAIVGGDSTPSLKPDPEPILYACRQLGVEPAESLHIGDSVNDALAARAAGCPVWLVPYGYTEGVPLTANDADFLVPDLFAAWQRARSMLSLSPVS